MKFQSKIKQLAIISGFLVSALSFKPDAATAAEGLCKTCKAICTNYNASLMDGDGNEKRDCQLDCKEECATAALHGQPTRTAKPPTIPCVVISENAVECKGEAYVKASANRGVLENRNFLENLKKFFAAPKQEADEEKGGPALRGY